MEPHRRLAACILMTALVACAGARAWGASVPEGLLFHASFDRMTTDAAE